MRGYPESHKAAVDRALRTYIFLLVFLTLVSLSVVVVRKYVLHRTYPRNTLLFLPEMRYSDFTGAAVRVKHFGEPDMLSRPDFGGPGYEVFPYPLPAVYAYLFFNRTFADPLRVFLLTIACSTLMTAGIFAIRLQGHYSGGKLIYVTVATTTLTCYPMLYLLDRGNLEGLVWILLLLAIFSFYHNLYTASAILLALAASLKLFPALLFVLFLKNKNLRPLLVAVFAFMAFTVLAWIGVGPTAKQAALDSSKSGIMLKEKYIIGLRPLEIGWDHSLLALVKQVAYLRYHWKHGSSGPPSGPIRVQGIDTAVMVYGLLAPVCFGFLYWFRLRSLPILNQIIALLLLSILLPFVSNEYTLVHAYLAWGAFIVFLLEDLRTGNVILPSWLPTIVLCGFAVVFTPQSYWVIGEVDNIGAQIKTSALVIVLCIFIRFPMPSSSLGDLRVMGTR